MKKTLEQKMYEHRVLNSARHATVEAWEMYSITHDYKDLKKYVECNDKLLEIFSKIYQK